MSGPTTGERENARDFTVIGNVCGHHWTIQSILEVHRIQGGLKYKCPECNIRRRVAVVGEAKRCARCKVNWIAKERTDDECFACIEKRRLAQAELMREAVKGLDDIERDMVLETLPASMPTIVRVSGVRWVDVQRILGEAIRAGDVVHWNAPGFRPLYRAVAETPRPRPRDVSKWDSQRGARAQRVIDEILPASMAAVADEMNVSIATAQRLLAWMVEKGLATTTGTGGGDTPRVYHAAERDGVTA